MSDKKGKFLNRTGLFRKMVKHTEKKMIFLKQQKYIVTLNKKIRKRERDIFFEKILHV